MAQLVTSQHAYIYIYIYIYIASLVLSLCLPLSHSPSASSILNLSSSGLRALAGACMYGCSQCFFFMCMVSAVPSAKGGGKPIEVEESINLLLATHTHDRPEGWFPNEGKFRKIRAPIKIKSALPGPPKPPPKTRNFMDMGFPAERTHFFQASIKLAQPFPAPELRTRILRTRGFFWQVHYSTFGCVKQLPYTGRLAGIETMPGLCFKHTFGILGKAGGGCKNLTNTQGPGAVF